MKWILLCALLVGCRNEVEKGIDAANQLFFEQRYARAESLYRRTLKRLDERDDGKAKASPDLLTVLDRLGRINMLYLHNYEQALSDYVRLVQDFPETEEAFAAQVTIADIYHHRLGDLAQAANEYQKLVKRFPNKSETPKYQLQLMELLVSMKNYEQAMHEGEQLVHTWPKAPEVPKANFDMAHIAYVTGQLDVALREYERILTDFPNDGVAPLVQFEMASAYQEKGNTQKALDTLYLALKTHPHPQIVQRKIARMKRRQNQLSRNKTIITDAARAPVKAAASKPFKQEEEEADE